MKNTILILLMLFSGVLAIAQNKVPTPDVNKMLKMTPAELEAYKKEMLKQTSQYATEFAKQNNLNISPSMIPGAEIKPPEKDILRLSLIPSRPPTRNELVAQVQQSIQQVQKGMPVPKIEEIQKFTSTQKIETIHDAAIASFYNNDPKEGIALLLIAAKESPDSLQLLNNLGAMLNMVGAEEKAIPLLQYCLNQLPKSSTVLNNLGQSFMGLGDLLKAADYLNKCLAIDSLNVEANHSMGMLHSFKKEYDQAIKYFNRELSVAFRASSMAAAYKTGKNFDLRALTKQKNRRNGRPEKNHFEEISLEKFSIPDYPATAQELTQRKSALIEYEKTIQEELFFWKNTALQTLRRYDKSDGDKLPGMYAPLVKAMLEELGKEFHSKYLNNFSDYDAQQLKDIINTYSTELIRVKCPPPPAGTGFEAQRAYEIKCCEEKQRPIIDKMFSEIAGLLEPILNVGQQRWKSYINQLVAIVELDPTISNQAMVYEAVSAYFNYLSWGSIFLNNESALNLIPSCVDDYKPEELDSLIASDRAWRLNCPPAFNVEVNLGTITMKADCSKYAVEGGEGIVAGLEHEFASNKSTLLLGVGTKAEFLKGIVKVEVKSQYYLTFDENKKLADYGIKNSGEIGVSGTPFPIRGIKLGGTLAGVEVSDTYSLHSGYREGKVEGKGIFAK